LPSFRPSKSRRSVTECVLHALKGRPAIPISHIVCTDWDKASFFTDRHAEMNEDPGMRTTTIDASHLCMLTDLEATDQRDRRV
jgi:hypothetical protein